MKERALLVALLVAASASGCDFDFIKGLRRETAAPAGGVDDAKAALQKGIEYYESGQIEPARQWFETLVLNNPSSADGFYYLGLCYLASSGSSSPTTPLSPEEQQSLDAFHRALALNPRHGLAALSIGDLYSRRLPPSTRKMPKDPPEAYTLALDAYQKAIAIDPKLPEAQYRYARFNERVGNLVDAENGYRAAALAAATVPEIAPDYYTYYARFLATQPNRASDAIEQYGLAQMFRQDDKALQREVAVLYARVGQSYFDGKQYLLAEDALKKAYGMFPDKNDPEAQKAEATLQELRAIRR